MDTLLLNTATWDIELDSKGNIALATGGYAIAQDVASACRTFLGEVWYNTTLGLPYFEQILGKLPSIGFLAAKYAAAADTIPDVDSVRVTLNPVSTSRVLTGKIEISNVAGVTTAISTQVGIPWYVTAVGNQDYGT